jgi:hypothetical protein
MMEQRAKQTHLHKVSDEALLILWRKGLSNGKIAKSLGVCHQTVANRLTRLGYKPNGTYSKPINRQQLMQLHAKGLDDHQIARDMGVSLSTIYINRARFGLASNGHRKYKLDVVDEDYARCSRCGEIKPIDEFKISKTGKGYRARLSFCRKCLNKTSNERQSASAQSLIRHRLYGIKNRCRLRNIPYCLVLEQVVELYRQQEGKCFYTGISMQLEAGNGKHPYALSIDRVDPTRGYSLDNIVLCINRANTIKNDLTLDELAEIIPSWYERLQQGGKK